MSCWSTRSIFLLAIRRLSAVRAGVTKRNQFKDRSAEPEISVTVANNILNQFELPVLFHACCLALFVTNGVSIVSPVLAWLFILTRYAHALVHVTINRVRYRSRLFRAGMVLVGLMWIWLAVRLTGAV